MQNIQKSADLDNLAGKFLEASHDSSSSKQIVPTQAYIEEAVESIPHRENKECLICLDVAPCARKMCINPLCRQWLANSDLITCPLESRFQVTDEENWTESSNVAKLSNFLERVLLSGSGAKSIAFSQWTTFLDLSESPMKKRGIGFLMFDGKLSDTEGEGFEQVQRQRRGNGSTVESCCRIGQKQCCSCTIHCEGSPGEEAENDGRSSHGRGRVGSARIEEPKMLFT